MIICVTGHRPDKLYGYDLTDPRWKNLKNIFKEKLIEMKCTNAISGMALGVDTIFALAVLELKKEGHPIQLHCALPCPEQCKKWNHVDIVFVPFDKFRKSASISYTVITFFPDRRDNFIE